MEPENRPRLAPAAIALVVGILALIIVWGAANSLPEPVACPEDALLCPDGTAVGREGADCHFPACPPVAATGTPTVKPPRPITPSPTPGPVACTADARLCPDGSGVGRDGNRSCAFSPCPGEGTARGVAYMGPTCPVQRENDPSCDDRPFVGTLVLTPSSGAAARVSTNSLGEWFVSLPPGRYAVSAETVMPSCSGEFSVHAGADTVADVTCDTGIR